MRLLVGGGMGLVRTRGDVEERVAHAEEAASEAASFARNVRAIALKQRSAAHKQRSEYRRAFPAPFTGSGARLTNLKKTEKQPT